MNIETTFSPETPLKPNLKTWHEVLENGTIIGYISDFKTEINSGYENGKLRKYSGLRVFVNLDKKQKGGFSFFVPHDPYFYVIPKKGRENNLIAFLKKKRKLSGTEGIKDVRIFKRHVFGKGNDKFYHKSVIYQIVLYVPNDVPTYSKLLLNNPDVEGCREYKIPFTMRCSIDLQLFSFKYYKFTVKNGVLRKYEPIKKETFPKLVTMTFDIEVRKKPIKKPQPDDPINIIGIKIGDKGFLINNVELTHFELPDFWIGVDKNNVIRKMEKNEIEHEYVGKYPPLFFKTINVKNERELLSKFYALIESHKPQAINGYASDFFDFPHIYHRGMVYGIDFKKLFDQDNFEGSGNKDDGTFFGDFKRYGVQMFDTMDWTERDSYVSKGMRGLKSISKFLLGIEAIEIDHEEQVRIWQKMENEWLNPNHPSNKDEKTFNENKKRAFMESLNHAVYCASDVYVTDIFAVNSSLGLNMAVASRIPMTFFEVARKKRGPMVEADLLNRMRGKMIAPPKVMKKKRNLLNPSEIKKETGAIYRKVGKRIDGEDLTFWAECKTFSEMKKHCNGCKNYSCREGWETIWKMPSNKWSPVLCERDSEGKGEEEGQVFFYPLENETQIVTKEQYEGALVECFNKGVFKDNTEIKFEINPKTLKVFKTLLHKALDRLIEKTESNRQNIKGVGNNLKVKVKDKEDLHKKIDEHINSILNELEEKDGKYYWNGLPVIIHVDVASMYPNIIITYNLQPYAIATEEECARCPYRPKEGEPPCWVDMDWNAVYSVMDITEKEKELAEREIAKRLETEEELDEEEIMKIYKKYSSKSRSSTYKFPMRTRFCQKSFKFFVNTVQSFRDQRYVYKYGMVEKKEEIEKIKSKYKKHPKFKELEKIAKEMEENEKEIDKHMENIRKIIGDKNTPKVIRIASAKLLQKLKHGQPVASYMKEIMEKISKVYGDRETPNEIKEKINLLQNEATTARNLQLGMKVLLNSFYGTLKSIGARFWSIEAAGATCYKGREIIKFAIDFNEKIANGINIEVDTDGVWVAFPSKIPLELNYEYFVEGNEKEIHRGTFNLFLETLNHSVKKRFVNKNNYVPIDSDGNYIPDIEYTDGWNKNRKWKPMEKCEIKYDYEGPYSTVFVYTRKRMIAFVRDKKNPNIQKPETITGLDSLRKGELKLIRTCSDEIISAYTKGSTIEESYKLACDVVNDYYEKLRNHTLDLDLLLESKDLSDKTAPNVNRAYKLYEKFLRDNNIDPMQFPVLRKNIKEASKNNPNIHKIWFGEREGRKVKSKGIYPLFNRTPYTFAAFRTIDLGIDVEVGDTIEWIMCKYPLNESNTKSGESAKSEHAVPTKLFEADEETIHKYMKKWFGVTSNQSYNVYDIIDWDSYIQRFKGMVTRYLIEPARAQGIDVFNWLKFKDENKEKTEKKVNGGVSLMTFLPTIQTKKKIKRN